MGAGIAQVCAQSGYLTYLMDVEGEALEKAHGGMEWSLHKLWEKGLLKDPPQTILKLGLKYCGGCNPTFNRVEFVGDLTASLDFVVQWVSF